MRFRNPRTVLERAVVYVQTCAATLEERLETGDESIGKL